MILNLAVALIGDCGLRNGDTERRPLQSQCGTLKIFHKQKEVLIEPIIISNCAGL